MILRFYRLAEQPFGVTPDPRFLYFSPSHREALASMLYGVSTGRGFTALIAQPGMGKTTILYDFLGMLRDHAKTVFLFQSQSSRRALLRNLLADLGIDDDGTDMVRLHRILNDCLLNESRKGRRLVVVIDEAQNLSESVLELVRMLSNFETPREKLLHLVLAGQPQLAEKLSSPRLTQLRQRISIIARLKPLAPEETQAYIDHRLRIAGYNFSKPLFTQQAYQLIAGATHGIPRDINNVCFNSLSLGCAVQERTIDVDVIREVLNDLDLNSISASFADPSPSLESSHPVQNVQAPQQPRHSSGGRWSLRFALALTLTPVLTSPISGTKPEIQVGTALTAPGSSLVSPQVHPHFSHSTNSISSRLEKL